MRDASAGGAATSGGAAAIRLPATGAAMFTRNEVQAACLDVCREHLELADPQAVVIN